MCADRTEWQNDGALCARDREFDAFGHRHGLADAFAAFLTIDAVALNPGAGAVVGREAIVARLRARQPGLTMRWTPLRQRLAPSGDMGVTYGSYSAQIADSDGNKRTAQGKYFSLWQRQADGAWLVVLDGGNDTPVEGPL